MQSPAGLCASHWPCHALVWVVVCALTCIVCRCDTQEEGARRFAGFLKLMVGAQVRHCGC